MWFQIVALCPVVGKAEEIVKHVLQPISMEATLNDISKVTYYSIATDASNKGSVKVFPVALRFFLPEVGVKNTLIDFYEDTDERATTVSMQLEKSLLSALLSLDNDVSFTADNANVMYHKHSGVFV